MKFSYPKLLILAISLLSCSCLFSQEKNITVEKIFTDSLSSSFKISINDSVRLHYHAMHTEHIFVLAGEARMQIGKYFFNIKKGEYYIIPKSTKHAVWVRSKDPLVVVSVQSPEFKGEDRHFIEE